eukprot:SM006071S19312  [mRNA]  locus=s6071:731:799:- [translate_table: standard]
MLPPVCRVWASPRSLPLQQSWP